MSVIYYIAGYCEKDEVALGDSSLRAGGRRPDLLLVPVRAERPPKDFACICLGWARMIEWGKRAYIHVRCSGKRLMGRLWHYS